jgi:hypothetical protein
MVMFSSRRVLCCFRIPLREYVEYERGVLTTNLALWYQFSPTQEVVGSVPVQIFVSMNMSVCIGSGCFYV